MFSDVYAVKKTISGQTKWLMPSLEMLPEIYGQRLKKSEGRENLDKLKQRDTATGSKDMCNLFKKTKFETLYNEVSFKDDVKCGLKSSVDSFVSVH